METSAHPRAKLDESILDSICEVLRLGGTRTAAAQINGIARKTLYEWIDAHPHVSSAIALAEAQAELRATAAVRKAMEGYKSKKVTVKETKDGTFTTEEVSDEWSPEAAQWWLERRRREEYGARLDLGGLPDTVLLELLGANRALPTASEYPSAPMALLTGTVLLPMGNKQGNSNEGETEAAGPGEGGSGE